MRLHQLQGGKKCSSTPRVTRHHRIASSHITAQATKDKTSNFLYGFLDEHRSTFSSRPIPPRCNCLFAGQWQGLLSCPIVIPEKLNPLLLAAIPAVLRTSTTCSVTHLLIKFILFRFCNFKKKIPFGNWMKRVLCYLSCLHFSSHKHGGKKLSNF